jgi:hypothetical protein
MVNAIWLIGFKDSEGQLLRLDGNLQKRSWFRHKAVGAGSDGIRL